MNKADFLKNVSRQLGRTSIPEQRPERDVIGVPEFWAEATLSRDECLTRFQERLTDLGGEVQVVEDVNELQTVLSELLGKLRPQRAGVWDDTRLHQWIGSALSSYEVRTWGKDAPEAFITTDVGITGCTFAIADTGTIALSCGSGRGRSVHLLPPVHIAIVGASQVCSRLGEALEALSSDLPEMDSYIHFVTGPSRSSDIENDQSIGVHGPAAEWVVIVKAL